MTETIVIRTTSYIPTSSFLRSRGAGRITPPYLGYPAHCPLHSHPIVSLRPYVPMSM